MKGKVFFCIAAVCALAAALYFGVRATFPRPYLEEVEGAGVEMSLVYAVMRAESGFDEGAVSERGAVGLMQLLPETAEFVCGREGWEFDKTKLGEGEYNLRIGCAYLRYLLGKFLPETAVAAYNAGEGRVLGWLRDPACSADGEHLAAIPYPETARYVKKVLKFRKIYDFFY